MQGPVDNDADTAVHLQSVFIGNELWIACVMPHLQRCRVPINAASITAAAAACDVTTCSAVCIVAAPGAATAAESPHVLEVQQGAVLIASGILQCTTL